MNILRTINSFYSRHNTIIKDCSFIVLIVLLSFSVYIGDLGFYSDDWLRLQAFSESKDQSILGLFQRANTDFNRMRPIETFYYISLWKIFGVHAPGYQIINALVFLLGMVCFYLVLTQLGQKRLIALSITIVYALLPHYSTDRFWIAAYPVTFSMSMYFFSLYADLKTLTSNSLQLVGWKLLSIISMLLSTLAYEIFIPFFFVNQFLLWYRKRESSRLIYSNQISSLKLTIIICGSVLILSGVIFYKAISTVRLTELPITHHINWFIKVLKEAFFLSYGPYGIELPFIVFKIIRNYFDFTILVLGLTMGIISLLYLYRVYIRENELIPSKSKMFFLIIIGIFIFFMGYSIFITSQNVRNTLAGINNRVAIAGAIGVAISMIGAIGLVSYLISYLAKEKHWREILFCTMISIVCTFGFIINNTIATFWEKSYSMQQVVLNKIRTNLPSPPKNSTLILDGLCPYIGPAIVFESYWGLGGALNLIYRDQSLKADVVKPNLTIGNDGLTIGIYYRKEHYPYKNLFIYNISTNKIYKLEDEADAKNYFRTVNPGYKNSCPQGREGYGVPIFWNELTRSWKTWKYTL